MGGEDRHLKSKIIKFDVPQLPLEGLYKIPYIGLMDWRGKLEEPIIAALKQELQRCRRVYGLRSLTGLIVLITSARMEVK
jgi:hypothetical protein